MIAIDPFLFLVLIEAAIVFFGLTLILFFRSRKYKKQLEQAKNALTEFPAPEPVPAPEAVQPEPPAQEPVTVEEVSDAVPSNVRKLLEIIDFQKQKILEMLCMRDLLDDAYRQLDMLRQKNSELDGRIAGLVDSSVKPEEFAETSAMFKENTRDLGHYLSVLQRSSDSIGEKMAMWEEQLKALWDEARTIGDEIPGAGVATLSGDASVEVSRLTDELRAAEDHLKKTQEELAVLKTQYEDIEKEYMILYSKQQAGTLGQ